MISASERCSLWEEAVNVLCMLLASRSMAQYGMVGIFHAFKQSPLPAGFFFYRDHRFPSRELVFSIAGWRRIPMAGLMW